MIRRSDYDNISLNPVTQFAVRSSAVVCRFAAAKPLTLDLIAAEPPHEVQTDYSQGF